ncbi:MAG: hydroxymethylbilane synthase [Hyphomonadaceae bacterium]|nr:hydroxymethylbilane synthase [Clostridia bacterium]
MKTIRIATRESRLALVQTEWVKAEILKKIPELDVQILPLTTKGDQILDQSLDKIGGKGLFIKELEQALLDGRADLAVHSLKDMPAVLPSGLKIAVYAKREDARDGLVGKKIDQLPMGAVVGTSSLRRAVQLEAFRPDIKIKLLRGNVLTRLQKLDDGQYDAIVLAMAGLNRLGLGDRVSEILTVAQMVPSVGQGILAIETRADADISQYISHIADNKAQSCALAERSFMATLNGNCSTPIAAHAIIDGESMTVYGMLAHEDKSHMVRHVVHGKVQEAVQLGVLLAKEIGEM